MIKESAKINICSKCILTSQIPNISFDENNICNFCKEYDAKKTSLPKDYAQLEKQMLSKLKVKKEKYVYDCMLLYSGGKDSTYILHRLVNHYKLKVLAFTFDNHFIPQETYHNINRVLKKIDIVPKN